jgi:membrane protease YdiL (CAAX protease family)
MAQPRELTALAQGPPPEPRQEAGAGRRTLELVLLFGLVPGALALAPRWAVSLGILASGLIALGALAFDSTFTRRELLRLGDLGAGEGIRLVLLRALGIAFGLFALTAFTSPGALFGFPRHRPVVWAIVMVLYPLSAYAQELVYRPFFFHRYGHLFSTAWGRILASGLLFGWAHIMVNNLLAIGLASIAGILFASTYERSRSTVLVSLEHALYGDVAFTIGLGAVFYSTARWVG